MSGCVVRRPAGSIAAGRAVQPGQERSGAGIMSAQPPLKGAWKITSLLFFFMLVNFADKIVVGLAGVPIMTELQLQPEQFGLLGSSFFLLFSVTAVIVGFFFNNLAPRRGVGLIAPGGGVGRFSLVGTARFRTLGVWPTIP